MLQQPDSQSCGCKEARRGPKRLATRIPNQKTSTGTPKKEWFFILLQVKDGPCSKGPAFVQSDLRDPKRRVSESERERERDTRIHVCRRTHYICICTYICIRIIGHVYYVQVYVYGYVSMYTDMYAI